MSNQVLVDNKAGDLTLHTGRAGVGSKVGHDLTLRVGHWTALADVGDAGVISKLRVIALLTSLEVLRGDGGLKPLSDKDKGTILGNAADTLHSQQHPEVVFEASDLSFAEGESSVTGTLTLAGVTLPQVLELFVHPGATRVQVRGELLQRDFGIKPYSGMLGALKVRDLVEIKADLTLPQS
jgi:hypothetical protein